MSPFVFDMGTGSRNPLYMWCQGTCEELNIVMHELFRCIGIKNKMEVFESHYVFLIDSVYE